ncbi:MAG: AI-2E family transporter [Candidatus Binatia bacterium]
MTRQQTFAAFFFAVFLFLLSQLYSLFSLFLKPLTWTLILVLTFYPAFSLLLRLFRGRRSAAALTLTLFIMLLVIVPLSYLSTLLTAQMIGFYQGVQNAVASGELQTLLSSWQETSLGQLWMQWAPRIEMLEIDVPGLLLKGANAASQYIVSHATDVAKNLLGLAFNFLIVSFSLFFFFRDGESLYETFRDLIPMEPHHKEEIFRQFYETVSAVVQGMVITAVVQGFLAGIGFRAAGLPYSFFLACAAAVSSLQPFGGTAAVWLPCAIYLGLVGSWGLAIALTVYGIFIISGVDNIIKPFFIGERTKLPTLFLFLGILGGLQAYGFLGVFLGPVILAIIVTFVRIYKETYAHEHDVLEQPPPSLPA